MSLQLLSRVLPLPAKSERMAIAADDSRVAFVRDHQLFVQIGDAKAVTITEDGSEIVPGGLLEAGQQVGMNGVSIGLSRNR